MVKSLETKDYIVDGNGRKLYPVSILDIKEEVDDLKQSSASKTYVNDTVKKAIDDIDIEQYITEEEIQKAVKDLALDDYAKKEDLEDYAKKSDTVNKSTYNHEMEIMTGKIQNVSNIEMDLDRRIESLEDEVFEEDGSSKIAQIQSNVEGIGTQISEHADRLDSLGEDINELDESVFNPCNEVGDEYLIYSTDTQLVTARAVQELIDMVKGYIYDSMDYKYDGLKTYVDAFNEYEVVKGNTETVTFTSGQYGVQPVTVNIDTSIINHADCIKIDIPGVISRPFHVPIKDGYIGQILQYEVNVSINTDLATRQSIDLYVGNRFNGQPGLVAPYDVEVTFYQINHHEITAKEEADILLQYGIYHN